MKPPSATARTLSMFTGKTDLEDPTRDGSKPSSERKRRAAKPRFTWHELRIAYPVRWVTDLESPDGTIEKLHEGYRVFVRGVDCGLYPTMAAAVTVAERVLSNVTKPEVMKP